MGKNYFKVAMRSLKRDKLYSFINIAGLAIGMACSLMILLTLRHELSFDRFHEKAGRIYRVAMDVTTKERTFMTDAQVALGPYLIERFPEVAGVVRLNYLAKTVVRTAGQEFTESNILYADPSFFEIFSFPLIRGDARTVLQTPYAVVLTETTAKRYFGSRDPIGQVLRFNDKMDVTVTGVVQDPPDNSHLRFDLLCSHETRFAENPRLRGDWIETNTPTYLFLKENAEARRLEKKMGGIIAERIGPMLKSVGMTARYVLQPLTRIHLYSPWNENEGSSVTGSLTHIYLFAAIAIFILGVAGINFMNLSTARSAKRAKEIGMRKVVGADRRNLIGQFLGESTATSLIALIVALAFVWMALPAFRSILGIRFSIGTAQLARLLPAFFLLAVIEGLAAGSYPAFFLSSFQPVNIMKGTFRAGKGRARFRRVLVGGQIALCLVLIVGTGLIRAQLRFAMNKKLGFDKDHVLAVEILDRKFFQAYEAIKARLSQIPGVVAVSASQGIPGSHLTDLFPLVPEGFSAGASLTMRRICADADYLPTLGMELAAGRNFSRDYPGDVENSIIINETAVRQLGWDHPLGKTIKIPVSPLKMQPKTVIGVVRDFHFFSLKRAIEPLCLENSPRKFYSLAVKVKTEDMAGLIGRLKDAWKEVGRPYPFDFFFLDEAFDSQYRSEERLSRIFALFSLLSIVIAALGLVGLSVFLAEQRTKEIGIRKIVGASTREIVILLSKEYVLIVALASVIAWPAAYLAMNSWLRNFAYRIGPNPLVFAASSLAGLAVALLTTGFQSLKVAQADPAEALRHE
jgi:putative ABC transport system permease protein